MIKVISCFHNRNTFEFRLTFFRVLCMMCSMQCAVCVHVFVCISVLFTVIFITIFIILSLKLKAPVSNGNNNKISCIHIHTQTHTFLDCLSRWLMYNAVLVNCVDWWRWCVREGTHFINNNWIFNNKIDEFCTSFHDFIMYNNNIIWCVYSCFRSRSLVQLKISFR